MLGCVRLLGLCAAAGVVLAARIKERAIAGDAFQSLDGTWRLQAQGSSVSLPASVPGDLLTDLEVSGVIGDPL